MPANDTELDPGSRRTPGSPVPTPRQRPPFGAVAAELLVALAAVALGIWMLRQTGEIRVIRSYAQVGPRVIPTIVGWGLIGTGAWLALDTLRGRGTAPADDAEDVDLSLPTDWVALGLIATALLAYLVLLERAGFVVASTALFAIAAFGMGSRHYLRDLVCAAGLALGAWFLFTAGLSLRLPAGWLEGIL